MTEIGEIPEEWNIKKISELEQNMYYGITAKATEQNTNLRMLRTTDIKNFKFNLDNLPFCEITEKRSDLSKYFLKRNDIIIARAGTVGVSILVQENLNNTLFGSYLIKIVFKQETIDMKFIHYYFQSQLYWSNISNAQGSTIKNINLPFLNSLEIPLPPLPEQQKIAEILSTADDEIQKMDEQIALAEQLKKGLMQKLLTRGIGHTRFKTTEIGEIPEEWDTFGLGEIFKTITGTTPSTKVKDYWHGGTIEWLTPKDLNKLNNTITLPPSERKVTEKALKENNLNILPENSILISTRAPVGYVGINNTKITFNQGCKGLVPLNRDVSFPFFYAYYLKSKTTFLNSLSTGSTFKELSKEGLDDVVVPLPPLPEQQKIGEILSTVDNKLELLGNKREKLNVLKKGLMNDLFTGKVRVKV